MNGKKSIFSEKGVVLISGYYRATKDFFSQKQNEYKDEIHSLRIGAVSGIGVGTLDWHLCSLTKRIIQKVEPFSSVANKTAAIVVTLKDVNGSLSPKQKDLAEVAQVMQMLSQDNSLGPLLNHTSKTSEETAKGVLVLTQVAENIFSRVTTVLRVSSQESTGTIPIAFGLGLGFGFLQKLGKDPKRLQWVDVVRGGFGGCLIGMGIAGLNQDPEGKTFRIAMSALMGSLAASVGVSVGAPIGHKVKHIASEKGSKHPDLVQISAGIALNSTVAASYLLLRNS